MELCYCERILRREMKLRILSFPWTHIINMSLCSEVYCVFKLTIHVHVRNHQHQSCQMQKISLFFLFHAFHHSPDKHHTPLPSLYLVFAFDQTETLTAADRITYSEPETRYLIC